MPAGIGFRACILFFMGKIVGSWSYLIKLRVAIFGVNFVIASLAAFLGYVLDLRYGTGHKLLFAAILFSFPVAQLILVYVLKKISSPNL